MDGLDAATREAGYSLIRRIDIGEARLFRDMTAEEIADLVCRFFRIREATGVYVSFPFHGITRIQISFTDDECVEVDEIARLLTQSLEMARSEKAMVWVRNENRLIIDGLQTRMSFNPPGVNNSHYAAVEYIMRRDRVGKRPLQKLSVRVFEVDRLDAYLRMLDEVMDFCRPPPRYAERREEYRRRFRALGAARSFEAFWRDDDLVGLYWRVGSEIDTMAVGRPWQRKGFGTTILFRAIHMALANTDATFAHLYCVDWNEAGRRFYEACGMEQSGHSYVLSIG